MGMIETVKHTIEVHGLLPADGKVILAVSGGADSMALLHACASLPRIHTRVAHVHHGLRGRAADADARFVRKAAESLGLPFHLLRADVRARARRRKWSLEMAAREIRHAFFRRLAGKYGACVATAHTRDDQAETVLLRWLRGSGTDGLGGMDYASELRGCRLIRPLLDVTHAEAMAFLLKLGQTWREDRSNDDPSMVRNRVRHQLLPLLEREFNPRIRDALVRTASVLRVDAELLQRLADQAYAVRRGDDGSLRAGPPLDPALRRRILYHWLLRDAGVKVDRLDQVLIRRVEDLAERGGVLTLPGRIQLTALRGVLRAKGRAT